MNNVSPPVTVIITCKIQPGQLTRAKEALATVIDAVITREAACRGIRVHQDPLNPQSLLIIEDWDSKEIFTGAHMQTDHMVAFMKLAESFVVEPAEFTFWHRII